jgi:hypothetical protein
MVSPLMRYSPGGKYDVSLDWKTPLVGGKMVFPGGEVLLLYGVCAEVRNLYGMGTECVRKCTEYVRNVYGMCNSPGGRNSPGWSMTPPRWGMMIFPNRK